LHFEGVGQKAQVFIFDKKVGEHTGGYDEWTVDVTEAVNKNKKNSYINNYYNGTIPVVIRTDNSRDVQIYQKK
jgi:beta-galactosidase